MPVAYADRTCSLVLQDHYIMRSVPSTPLTIRPRRHVPDPAACVQDLENTVGAWDMYGVEDSKRYPSLQNEFFERAASGISTRGSMLRFLAVGMLSTTSHVWSCLRSSACVLGCSWPSALARVVGVPHRSSWVKYLGCHCYVPCAAADGLRASRDVPLLCAGSVGSTLAHLCS